MDCYHNALSHVVHLPLRKWFVKLCVKIQSSLSKMRQKEEWGREQVTIEPNGLTQNKSYTLLFSKQSSHVTHSMSNDPSLVTYSISRVRNALGWQWFDMFVARWLNSSESQRKVLLPDSSIRTIFLLIHALPSLRHPTTAPKSSYNQTSWSMSSWLCTSYSTSHTT